MDIAAWIGLGIQTVIILAGIVGLHMRTRDRITTLEANHLTMDKAIVLQRTDHDKLEVRIGGMSRHLEHVRAKVE